jgi:hypothetical protein
VKLENYRLLQVASDSPFPPNYGGRVDPWRRLQTLSELGCRVDLLITLKRWTDAVRPERVREHCDDLLKLDRQLGLQSLAPGTPYQWASRRALSRTPVRNDANFLIPGCFPAGIMIASITLAFQAMYRAMAEGPSSFRYLVAVSFWFVPVYAVISGAAPAAVYGILQACQIAAARLIFLKRASG